jgi:hypothetical protein
MPTDQQTPITPEGRRAAEKIRTLFYSIVAANIVLIAIVMMLGKGRKDPAQGAIEKPAAEKPVATPPPAEQPKNP